MHSMQVPLLTVLLCEHWQPKRSLHCLYGFPLEYEHCLTFQSTKGGGVGESVEGDSVGESVEGDSVGESVEGDSVEEFVEGDSVEEFVEGNSVEEFVEGDSVEEFVEGDSVEEFVEDAVRDTILINPINENKPMDKNFIAYAFSQKKS